MVKYLRQNKVSEKSREAYEQFLVICKKVCTEVRIVDELLGSPRGATMQWVRS